MSAPARPEPIVLNVGDHVTPNSGSRRCTRWVITKAPQRRNETKYTAHPVGPDGATPDLEARGLRGVAAVWERLDRSDGALPPPAVVTAVPYLPPLNAGQTVTTDRPLLRAGDRPPVPPGTPLTVIRTGSTYSVIVAGTDGIEYWRGQHRERLTAVDPSRVNVTITPQD